MLIIIFSPYTLITFLVLSLIIIVSRVVFPINLGGEVENMKESLLKGIKGII